MTQSLFQKMKTAPPCIPEKIDGTQVQFIVSENQSVVLQYGDKTYGPYTIKKDPSAVPKNEEAEGYMTGASKSVMEIRYFFAAAFHTPATVTGFLMRMGISLSSALLLQTAMALKRTKTAM